MIFQIKNNKFLKFYNFILKIKKKYVNKKNNSSFVILILIILLFRNPGRSRFAPSIFCIPLKNFQLKKFQKFLIWKIS